MSAGKFTRSRYEATNGTDEIHPIRVQPETISLALTAATGTTNSPPSGSVNNQISALVSRGARAFGLKPRSITIEVTGDPPTGYAEGSRTTLPVLTESFYAAVNEGVSVNYLGTTWQVVSKNPESAN